MHRKMPMITNGKNTKAPIVAPAIQKGTAHDAITREAMPSSIFLIDFIKNFSFLIQNMSFGALCALPLLREFL